MFFFKQKTACEIDVCDWSTDVCSSEMKKEGEGVQEEVEEEVQEEEQEEEEVQKEEQEEEEGGGGAGGGGRGGAAGRRGGAEGGAALTGHHITMVIVHLVQYESFGHTTSVTPVSLSPSLCLFPRSLLSASPMSPFSFSICLFPQLPVPLFPWPPHLNLSLSAPPFPIIISDAPALPDLQHSHHHRDITEANAVP